MEREREKKREEKKKKKEKKKEIGQKGWHIALIWTPRRRPSKRQERETLIERVGGVDSFVKKVSDTGLTRCVLCVQEKRRTLFVWKKKYRKQRAWTTDIMKAMRVDNRYI